MLTGRGAVPVTIIATHRQRWVACTADDPEHSPTTLATLTMMPPSSRYLMNQPGRRRAEEATTRARRRARGYQLYHALNALFVLQWRDFLAFLWLTAKWILLGSAAGVLAGTASWIFLTSLAWATSTRVANPALLYALPLVGFIMGWLYHRFGKTAALGNNLVIEEVNSNRSQIPTRMAPLVLLGTIVTHLCGGSAGREGTAIQMGASLADRLRRMLGLAGEDRRLLLMAGISGGFGSVFGVPVAGFVFGMEVQGIGRIRYDGMVPCLVAAFVGDLVARALGTPHAHYPELPLVPLQSLLLLKVVVAGVAFGLTSITFIELIHGIKHVVSRVTGWSPLYPVIGGVAIIGLTWLVGSHDYLGLSLPLITASVEGGAVAPWAFALKTLFTAITLGTGYLGGEVTPLFVIGSTLGHALSQPLAVDPGLLASIGLVAVFAGASNTPLACALMGVELFGSGAAPYLFLGCVVAYLASGHRGIYMTQRIHQAKTMLDPLDPAESLHGLRSRRGGGWLPPLSPLAGPLEAQPVAALMAKPAVAVAATANVRDALVQIIQTGVRTLPVVDARNRIVGILTDHDLERSRLRTSYQQLQQLSGAAWQTLQQEAAEIPIMALAASPVSTLGADATVAQAVHLLQNQSIKRLPIVDREQRVVGMLTRSDILRNLLYLPVPGSPRSAAEGARQERLQSSIGALPLQKPPTVTITTTVSQLLQALKMHASNYALVTNSQGHAVGMISSSDLLTRTTAPQHNHILAALYAPAGAFQPEKETSLAALTVAELMTTPLLTIHPDDRPHRALQLLIERQIKRLPVVDDSGDNSGDNSGGDSGGNSGDLIGIVDRRALLDWCFPVTRSS